MQVIPYLVLLACAASVALVIAWFAIQQRSGAGALALAWLALSVTVWVLAYALELGSVEESSKILAARIQYIGIVNTPLAWLTFASNYAGASTSRLRRILLFLLPIPITTFILVMTNDAHHLVWQDIHRPPPDTFPALVTAYGPWFWVHTAFSYICMFLGTRHLLRIIRRAPNLYRSRVGAVLVSAIAPWVGNILYVTRLSPLGPLDLTPFTFALSAGLLGWTLFRFHLFEIVPIAHNTIIENMRDAVLVLDQHCRVIELNRSAERIAQLPAHLARGRQLSLILPGQAELIERCRSIAEERVEIALELDEHERIYEAHISPLINSRDQVYGRILTLHDITERTTVENQLRRQNFELNALHQTALGLVNGLEIDSLLKTLVRRAGVLLDTPHGYLFLLDAGNAELVARVTTGIFGSQIGYRLKRGEGLAGKVWERGEAMWLDCYSSWDGRRRDFDDLGLQAIISVPIRFGEEFAGVLGLAYLEQSRTFSASEIALLQRFADLASLVLENARLYSAAQQEIEERRRTEAELRALQADLRTAKDQAEAVTHAKSEFLAHMSHEIRTPITSVIGMTELLAATTLSDDQRAFVEIIRTGGDALLQLVNNLLDLARLESGRLELAPYPFELRQCVEEAIDLVAARAAQKKLDVAYTLDRTADTTLIGDRYRLRQILVNLLSNAVKFTNSGGVFVSVRAQDVRPGDSAPSPQAPSSCNLQFSVEDTGIGIPPEHHADIFDSFRQLSQGGSRHNPGTGLGLTISKSLSELMGGGMWVESDGRTGATFHFTVQVRLAEFEQAYETREISPNPAGMRAMLVTERAQTGRAVVEFARSVGIDLSVCAAFDEAIVAVSQGMICHVAILDMRADDLWAVAAARRLLDAHPAPRPGVIVLAPLGARDEKPALAKSTIVLRKPLKLSQLQRALHALAVEQPHVEVRPPQTAPAGGMAIRLLLVEDDDANREVALQVVARLGIAVRSASTGEQALAAIEQACFDIILLDLQLPDIDGGAVAQAIRQRWPAEPQPYIVAFSATLPPAEALHRDGFDDLIEKPLRVNALQLALARYATRHRGGVADRERMLGADDTGSDAPESDANDRPALDSRLVAQLRANLGDQPRRKLATLVERYLADAAAQTLLIRQAIDRGEVTRACRTAHKLKSSSMLMGAVPLAELCGQIETSDLDESGGWHAQLSRIGAELERVAVALEHELKR